MPKKPIARYDTIQYLYRNISIVRNFISLSLA